VQSGDDFERSVDAFVALHRLSSAEKAAFMTSQMEAYFRDLCAMTMASGMLRMGVLWVGDTPVSAALGFAYKGRLYLYNSGYDPAYAGHSVGIAAVGLLLKDSAAESLEIFDFLQGDEPYKYTLGARDRSVYRVLCSRGPRL
jgi:CelD/BcsL family acetyltransferase involved in cellulose biosynthesis